MPSRVRIIVTVSGSRAEAAFRRIRAAAASSVRGIGDSFSNLRPHAKLVVAAIIAIFAALPAALGLIAALLPAAIAGGFIAIGALAFKSTREVKSAFESMKDSVVDTVREAAAPMKGAIVDALARVGAAAQKAKPLLTEIFANTAELTGPLVDVFTSFVQSLLPGFNSALQGSLPIIEGMKDGMSRIGEGIGNMIAMMTSNKAGLADFWRVFGESVASLFETIGELTSELIDSGQAADSVRLVFGFLEGSVKALSGAYRLLNGDLTVFIDLAKAALEQTKQQSQQTSLDPTGGFIDDFFDKVMGKPKRGFGAEEEAPKINGLADAISQLRDSGSGASEALMKASETIAQTAEEARLARDAVQELVNQFYELNRQALSAMEAEAGMHDAIAKATEAATGHTNSLKFRNGELDLANAKTREAAQPLFDIAEKTLAAAAAADKNGESWEVQRGLMETGRQGLIRAAKQMGLTSGQARTLADRILAIPSKKHTRFTADASQAFATIRRLQGAVASVVSSATASIGNVLNRAFAHGGIRGAATGGVRSNLTMVGEHGPELVNLPPGSHVRSNPDTRRFLRGAGGGGGAGGTFVFKSSGRRVDDMLIEILREAIHQRGGDPVTVLGG